VNIDEAIYLFDKPSEIKNAEHLSKIKQVLYSDWVKRKASKMRKKVN
jgi:hypothetical protein